MYTVLIILHILVLSRSDSDRSSAGGDFGQHPELSADCYPRRFVDVIFYQLHHRGF